MKKILFSIIGAISIILSIVCFCGGTASAPPINEGIFKVVNLGFGSLLLIAGLLLIALGILSDEKKDTKDK